LSARRRCGCIPVLSVPVPTTPPAAIWGRRSPATRFRKRLSARYVDRVTIHTSDPFATPEGQRSPVRRLRSRLPSPVTIWTAGDLGDASGLTVSSVLIADGDPGRVIGLIDDESELWSSIEAGGRFAVMQLEAEERLLADRFAGLLPAPGGLFRGESWDDTDYGPVLPGHSWAGCVLDQARPYGWGMLIEATIQTVHLDPEGTTALAHRRGRYLNL
jgi:3-hydroxy-9,10-secoandrosta-1,3,5(10)-triene-9,17-dione monooxygenase reductase component